MKFSSSLAVFSLVAGISAAPAAPPSDGAITVYRAKVTSYVPSLPQIRNDD